MSYWNAYFIGGQVLWEVMSNRHTSLTGEHAYRMAYLTGWHILQDDLSYRKTHLIGGLLCMYYKRPCITWACLADGHVL